MSQGFDIPLAKLEFETVRQRVMRYAVSEPGRDLLRSLPISTSLAHIRSELARVSETKRLLEQEESLPLDGIFPIRKALGRSGAEGAVLLPRELFEIGSTIRTARIVRTFASKRKEQFPLLWDTAENLHTDKVLEFNIDQAVDDTGAVRASASRELQNIRRAIADRYEQLKKRLGGILRTVSELGFSQEEIITTREGRMVIPVKVEHKNRVPGFVHSASSSGATVFIEPTETLELNNEIRNLQFEEQREIERILKALTAQVAAARERVGDSLGLLADCDAVQARARYSIEILGVEPTVADDGPIRLLQARHPILLMHHGFAGTVPLDLTLGQDFATLLISGPNAGGKSVAMKAVGLLVLMTQAGMHIPAADGSQIRVFSAMFVDIGDEQSIESDLSTFSSHLKNLKEIAERAGNETLVLIDEIGSGTDPAEGGAIAAAVLEQLTRRGALTIATTHQGALKVFAHETEGIENGAMEFDQSTLQPTYRYRPGIPGSSYALEMADRLGFDQSMMTRARTMLGHHQTRLEHLLSELEASTQQYRRTLEEVQHEKSRLDELVRQYEAKTASLASELRAVRRKALDEARMIVENANTLVEKTVREIREHNADKDTIRVAREQISNLKEDIAGQRETVADEEPRSPAEPVAVGTLVHVRDGTDVGEVVSLAPDGRSAVIVVGIVKLRVHTSDLRPARTAQRPSMAPPHAEPPSLAGPVQQDLDIRGMTGDEAIPLVDKFIDTAILAGLHRVDIIHGKGTGALRKKIAEFLSKNSRVRSFHLAEWNEGGTGATTVELEEG
jgi:DNA mismatch repair protein MutS2